MGLRHIMAYLRLSGYDARLLKQLIAQIRKVLPDSSPNECGELLEIIDKVWEWYYHIGEEQDLAFELGTLLYEMDALPEALDSFQISIEDHGESATTLYNMAACYISLQQEQEALNYLDKVLKTDPQHRAAIEMKNQLNLPETSKMTG